MQLVSALLFNRPPLGFCFIDCRGLGNIILISNKIALLSRLKSTLKTNEPYVNKNIYNIN